MIPALTLSSLISTFLYLCLGVIVASICYPLSRSKFQISYHRNPKNLRRIEKCPNIKRGRFIPTPYLASGVLQATFGRFSKHHDPNIQFQEELLNLPCGGKIGLHWASQVTVTEKAKARDKKVIVMMLPGLTASSGEPYIRNISTEALENGYKVVVYHNRGNRIDFVLPTEGHFDQFMDVKHAVDHIKQRYPDHKLFAVGHSYGANTLINYIGRWQNEHRIDVAASIANPFDFLKAATDIHGTMFDLFLAQTMQGFARRNEQALINAPKHLNIQLDIAMKATTLPDFDEHVTRRIYGFPDVNSYYNGIKSADQIPKVNIPMLVLASKDDPVINYISCPVDACAKNENIITILTSNGGHVGWFEGVFKPTRWYPKPTIEFLNSCYEEMV